MPRHLPRRFASARRAGEAGPVAERQHALHHLVIGAAVVVQAERVAVRHRAFRHQVAPPQLDAIEAALARRQIDQPLHHEHRLGPAGAAIGPGRRGVGQRRAGAEMHGRHVVDAGHDLDALVQRAERDGIRAAVDDVGAAHRQERALRIEREFGIGRQVARLIVAQECLAALAGPFHRAADAPRRPGDQRELRIGCAARAEIAADIVHHHAHVVVRDAEHHGHVVPRAHRAAGAGVQRVASGRGVVFADRRARLHRHAGDALHRGARDAPHARRQRTPHRSRRHRRPWHRGRDSMRHPTRRSGAPAATACAGMDHGRQFLVVHHDEFGGVLRRGKAVGHDHRDDVADMAHLVGGHRIMRRNERRRAVRVLELDVGRIAGAHRMRDRLQPVGQQIAAGQHRKHAGRPSPVRHRSIEFARARAASGPSPHRPDRAH